MTAGEQLMERGRQQERRKLLLDLLGERFGAVPDAAVARVATADMAQLLVWSKRVLTAPMLDNVFAC